MIVEAGLALVGGAVAGAVAGYAAMRLAGQLDVAVLAGHEARLKRLEGLEGKTRRTNREEEAGGELQAALVEVGVIMKSKGSLELADLMAIAQKYPTLAGQLMGRRP